MNALLRLCAACAVALVLAGPTHAHWQDQPPHQMAELGEFKLERGGVIANLKMSYVTHGKLNAAKDNAILFLHGFGGHHHMMDYFIGPGRALDTDRYFIICSDALGATQTGYEHSTSPSNSGLKMAFPHYGSRDMVKAQYLLVTRGLGIPHLLAATGISSGGQYSLQLAAGYPGFVDGTVPLVGTALWGATGSFRSGLALALIESCVGWNGGQYDDNPKHCATNAISQWVYSFYTRDWWEQHIDTPEAFQRWRTALGAYYLDVQDTRDLWYLLKSFDRGWLGDTPGFNGDVFAVLRSIQAKTLFVYNPRDEQYTPQHIEAQVRAMPNARAVAIDSNAGHTIWYNADPQATVAIGKAISDFLTELTASRTAKR